MDKLFRLSVGARQDPLVDTWFDARPDALGLLAREWFEVMKAAGEDTLEMIHDGYPTACIQDVPFGYVNVFTAHLNIGFYTGAFLPDPSGLLLGSGKRMRHVRVSPVKSVDEAALKTLIQAAYADVQSRMSAS